MFLLTVISKIVYIVTVQGTDSKQRPGDFGQPWHAWVAY